MADAPDQSRMDTDAVNRPQGPGQRAILPRVRALARSLRPDVPVPQGGGGGREFAALLQHVHRVGGKTKAQAENLHEASIARVEELRIDTKHATVIRRDS